MGQPEVTETRTIDRPWTVYAFVLFSVVGLAWGQIVDVERTLWDVVAIAVSVLIVWGLWTGKQWAFSISFMLSSLCVALAAGAALVQLFLMELSPHPGLIVSAVVCGVWVALLMRPETKRFAGLDRLTPSSR